MRTPSGMKLHGKSLALDRVKGFMGNKNIESQKMGNLTWKSWNILQQDYYHLVHLDHQERVQIRYTPVLGNQTLGYPSCA